jgi:hypothetical protein
MSILVIEAFEIAANGYLDLTVDNTHQYTNPETIAAFWAWGKSRESVVVSLPAPIAADSPDIVDESYEKDLFTREQIIEIIGAAGVSLQ